MFPLNKVFLIGVGGFAVAGTRTGLGVYYGTQGKGTSTDQKPNQTETHRDSEPDQDLQKVPGTPDNSELPAKPLSR